MARRYPVMTRATAEAIERPTPVAELVPLPADLTLVVPTFNERDNVSLLVERLGKVLGGIAWEVVFVDDDSPDGTGKLADELAARDRRVRVLHRKRKEGLGRAYLAGFAEALAAGYGRILEMDADFSHDPARLPVLLGTDADVVLGSRYVPGGGAEHWGLGRRLLSRGGSVYARTILGIPVRDLTGGFKCFRRKVLEALDLKAVHSNGYAFQIELTYRAIQRGFKVVEIPITFVDRRVGKSKMSRAIVLEALWMVWKIRFSGRP